MTELEKKIERILAIQTTGGKYFVPSGGIPALEHKRKVQQLAKLMQAHAQEERLKAKLDEVPKYAPINVAHYFEISSVELNSAWYFDFCHHREAELKSQLRIAKYFTV